MAGSDRVDRARRTFVAGALGLAAGAAAASARGSDAASAPLETRPIPASGERIGRVGLGTWRGLSLGERESSRAVLQRFHALGGRVVDTSPMYGDAEEAIGTLGEELGVLPGLFLATKVWTRGRREGERQVERSFRLLRRDPIDLIQVHNLLDLETQLPLLRRLKEAGRIRYLGITHYLASAHDELARVLEREPIDFLQVNYSAIDRAAERRLLPLAAGRGVAVLANQPFAEGRLFSRVRGQALPAWASEWDCASWGQLFLKFILGHPAITCVIPGTLNPRHVEDNLGAARGRLPEAGERERLAQLLG
ncbi:MAG: aldo/keto reductase [Steroidobacteraceae bacterium]|jgi:aryl-alcohol dehydrogenase-like predicted oxidoreductase|nr:aldo/keto reductase [Steroidobacteraceae bacterium]